MSARPSGIPGIRKLTGRKTLNLYWSGSEAVVRAVWEQARFKGVQSIANCLSGPANTMR
jgi:hypothetical protein